MLRTTSMTALAAATLILGACSTATTDEQEPPYMLDARLGNQVDRVCFTSSIDNFRNAEDDAVIVERGVDDEYLITTSSSCFGLDRAQSLSFDTMPGSGCITRGDFIHAYDTPFGPDRTDVPPTRCPISGIYEWNEDALNDELDAY